MEPFLLQLSEMKTKGTFIKQQKELDAKHNGLSFWQQKESEFGDWNQNGSANEIPSRKPVTKFRIEFDGDVLNDRNVLRAMIHELVLFYTRSDSVLDLRMVEWLKLTDLTLYNRSFRLNQQLEDQYQSA